jgi:hypothetical protein
MPSLKDLAVVSVSSGAPESLRAAINGSADSDLETSAWLAHQYMLGEAQRNHAPEIPGAEPGASWLLWDGALVSVIIELQLGKVSDGTGFGELRRAISARLRLYGNAVCTRHGNARNEDKRTQWGVRTEFRSTTPDPELVPILTWTKAKPRTQPATPSPGSAPQAPATATVSVTPASPAPEGESEAGDVMLRCEACGAEHKPVYLARHVFTRHGRPDTALLEYIKRHHTATRAELAEILSKVAYGGIVSASYIGSVLKPYTEMKGAPIAFHKGWADNCRYEWVGGDSPVPGSAAAAITEQPARFTAASLSRSPATPPVPPVTSPLAFQVPATALSPRPPVPPAAPPAQPGKLSEPSFTLELDELLDAFKRHMLAYAAEISKRVKEAEAKAAVAAAAASEADKAELEELRALKVKFQALLGG